MLQILTHNQWNNIKKMEVNLNSHLFKFGVYGKESARFYSAEINGQGYIIWFNDGAFYYSIKTNNSCWTRINGMHSYKRQPDLRPDNYSVDNDITPIKMELDIPVGEEYGEITLAEPCDNCERIAINNGFGGADNFVFHHCFQCSGKGLIMTSNGKAMKKFFEKFG